MKKILSITATRAEYGLMRPIFRQINADKKLELHLLVTGSHFLANQQNISDIKQDSFGKLYFANCGIDRKSLSMPGKYFSKVMTEVEIIIIKINPDYMLLQGDRGEVLAAAIVSGYYNIPLIHMSGGDSSGSIDDSIRNSISKIAHIHLTTCRSSSKKLIRTGESTNRIFEVGEPGIDAIKNTRIIPLRSIRKEFGLKEKPYAIFIQHPVSTESSQAVEHFKESIEALSELNIQVILIFPNTDPGNLEIIDYINSIENKNIIKIQNINHSKYINLLRYSSVLVGNSSSGIIESPSLHIPTVNIGTRQQNREKSTNIIDVTYSKKEIKSAILKALSQEFINKSSKSKSIYGNGNTTSKTISIIKKLKTSPKLLNKWQYTNFNFIK